MKRRLVGYMPKRRLAARMKEAYYELNALVPAAVDVVERAERDLTLKHDLV
jgi:hypothetical protein